MNISLLRPHSWKDLHCCELPDIRFSSLAHNEVEDLNILFKSIYCISGPIRVQLKSLLSTLLSPPTC